MSGDNFPVYLQYPSGSSYFKIISETEFEELQLVGKKVLSHKIKAKQYPEMLLIKEMLSMANEKWLPLTEEEYRFRLKQVKNRIPH